MEQGPVDGDRPVSVGKWYVVEFLSNARPEKSGVNLGSPLSKAKYSHVTDSERVP